MKHWAEDKSPELSCHTKLLCALPVSPDASLLRLNAIRFPQSKTCFMTRFFSGINEPLVSKKQPYVRMSIKANESINVLSVVPTEQLYVVRKCRLESLKRLHALICCFMGRIIESRQ